MNPPIIPPSGQDHHVKGLEGVIALNSSICHIDGRKGTLVYRGYAIEDLAENSTFEDVAYLLWHGQLPGETERNTLNEQLVSLRHVPEAVLDLLGRLPADFDAMAALRTGISLLSHYDPEANDGSKEANYRKALRLTAQIPVLIAALVRHRHGQPPIPPRTTGSTAENFLYMLTGEQPGVRAIEALDAALVLHAEHGLNASTFAARVIGATLSDIYSAVTGGVAALKGALHGGANTRVMLMLLDLHESGEDPAEFVRRKLAAKERIMGFGHRVYKTLDPRANVLRQMVTELGRERDSMYWVDLCSVLTRVMEEEKGINANVDFYSGLVYHLLGIEPEFYTTLFVMGRITGWTAHLMEQWEDNRLIRPRAAYTGPMGLRLGNAAATNATP
ncbi:MAG: citrate synthase [Rhodothermaceae bacterium]|nr:citrate synthase [Rhodothermaceae bacterium]MXW31510.1 citrate synthase [Rhodothermaceae bacterium]MXZ17687.1 citrate synthase [Rhodothermaceae bacterium]MYC04238.1 citrate synthase [Rhodothermaceae bacterium]MYE63493.1 citrate synthase [Rhodothermaceae bacterium]